MGEPVNTRWTLDTLKEFCDVRFAALREVADLKVIHLRELRESDQKALDLVAKNNAQHFAHLNENAKRTIEERSHFVSMEAFTPFKEAVEKSLNQGEGKTFGLSQGWAILIGAVGLLCGIVSIFYDLAKH